MGTIIYDDNSLIEFKNNVNTANTDILEALQRISHEVDNINVTINTPNSKKTILDFNDYFKNKVNYLDVCRDACNTYFDGVKTYYNETYEATRDMVGGNND
jgi:hypothetical protein